MISDETGAYYCLAVIPGGCGKATLVDGQASVALSGMAAGLNVHLTNNGPNPLNKLGILYAVITPGVGFEIRSTDAHDNSVISYLVARCD